MFEAYEVKGVIPLGVPNGRTVMAQFEITAGGDFVLQFNDRVLVNTMMSEAVRNNLVHLELSYATATPAESEVERVSEDSYDFMPSLGEDVRSDAMDTNVQRHADGRKCSFHFRLGKYTPDGLNECLRLHVKERP